MLRNLEADIRCSHAKLDAKINRRLWELEMRIWRIELNRLTLLLMLVNVLVTAGVTALLDAFKHP